MEQLLISHKKILLKCSIYFYGLVEINVKRNYDIFKRVESL